MLKASWGTQVIPGYPRCPRVLYLGTVLYMINRQKIYAFKSAYYFIIVADAYLTIYMEPT